MSAWIVASLALLPPLAAMVVMCGRGAPAVRIVAAQTASALGLLLLVALTFGLQQASSIDLALTFGLLTLPATLLFAVFLERWL